jgi:antitoxin component YwqK of YwqJK toxin-antitoxin module
MNNINQYNDNGKKHGYWEVYHSNGNLIYKGNYINGKRIGYWEDYYSNGCLSHKQYFL